MIDRKIFRRAVVAARMADRYDSYENTPPTAAAWRVIARSGCTPDDRPDLRRLYSFCAVWTANLPILGGWMMPYQHRTLPQ